MKIDNIKTPAHSGGNELKCLNSKGGRNGVVGLQPSLTNRVYDADGIATAIATSTFFMPCYLVKEKEK